MKTPVTDAATFETDTGHSVVLAEVSAGIESSRNELLAALEITEKYVAAAKAMADKAFLNDTGSAAAVAKAGGDLISVRAAIANARKLAVNTQHSSQLVTQNKLDVRDKRKETS